MSQPLTFKQVAAELGCSVDQVRRLADAGEIVAINIGMGAVRRRRVVYSDELRSFKQRRQAIRKETSPTGTKAAYRPRWS